MAILLTRRPNRPIQDTISTDRSLAIRRPTTLEMRTALASLIRHATLIRRSTDKRAPIAKAALTPERLVFIGPSCLI